MAKSTKKPNTFSKGMQTDLDPNLASSESYKSAFNARLMTKEDNSFVLKSAEGNSLVKDLSEVQTTYSNFNLTTSTDVRTTGLGGQTTDINVTRYVDTITYQISINATTYSYTYTVPFDVLASLTTQSGSDNSLLVILGLFAFLYSGSADATAILAAFDVNFTLTTVQFIPYDTSISYSLVVTGTEKSRTFTEFRGMEVGNIPADHDDNQLIGTLAIGDKVYQANVDLSNQPNFTNGTNNTVQDVEGNHSDHGHFSAIIGNITALSTFPSVATISNAPGYDLSFAIGVDDSPITFNVQAVREHDTTGALLLETYTIGSTVTNEGEGYATATIYGTYTTSTTTDTYEILGLESFNDYIVALCHNPSTGLDKIVKMIVSADGTITGTNVTSLFTALDLGFTSKTKIRTAKSEENETFHRLYWTDGINPLRSLNLKESGEYYQSLSSADSLNVFSNKKLPAPTVNSIKTGGVVTCGSHSYCYRLISEDGKTSRISNITNPIQIYKDSKSNQFFNTQGGALDTASTSSVTISVDNIDTTYTSIQIINIRYTSREGGIEANIISEGNISNSAYQYTHNGNETKIGVSLTDLLANKVSWGICKDIAIKDNRLFAANLKNTIEDISESFRVKSYKYANSSWIVHSDVNNPDINDEVFYDDGLHPWYKQFSLIKGSSFSNARIPGAETNNFSGSSTGVRVTFRTKKFDLGSVNYFSSTKTSGTSSDLKKAATSVNQVPLYNQSLGKSGPDGYYNNYQNPKFAEQFTGYQRGEIYRFGILFYDKSGNPGFVSPIGDVRMPDSDTIYSTLDDSGNHITTGPDGQKTFKYCGSESFSDSTCDTDSSTNQNKVTHTANDSIAEGLHVHGPGIPPGTRITTIDSATQFTISNNATATGTNVTLFFTDPTSDINGYVLYPHFEVKLSQAILNSIGGYSIVRVDRTDNDKRVLASGVITETTITANNNSSSDLRHKNIVSAAAHAILPNQGEGTARSMFTFDSPDIVLGNLDYTPSATDKLKVNARLDTVQQTPVDEILPSDLVVGDLSSNVGAGFATIQVNASQNFAFGRFDANGNNNDSSFALSVYGVYTLNDDSVFYYNKNMKEDTLYASMYRHIGHAERVGPAGVISKSKMGYDYWGSGQGALNFENKSMMTGVEANTSDNFSPIMAAVDKGGYSKLSASYAEDMGIITGCDTLFVAIDKTQSNTSERRFQFNNFGASNDDNILQRVNRPLSSNNLSATEINRLTLYASKLYTSIIREVGDSRYGGNQESNFANNQYISTGHVNFSPALSNKDEVFGGDTFINMYAYRKFHREELSAESDWLMPSVGLVIPVESTVNVDMRTGNYFGFTETLSYNLDDQYLYNDTYSCRNTTKTFLQKPSNFDQINTYSNMIAASNLKLNGDISDAYTGFDSNEVHELSTEHGPIYNIFNLRGDLFVLQQSGVSKLGVNPRVVVDNSDAAAVTIATGTGRVIERSDYIDTKYGSQHYNNVVVTNANAYWFDSNMSSFCKLVYGQGIAVQDLGLVTQNASLFDALKDLSIGDEPLDTTKGGICLYKDDRFNEVSLSITHPTYTNNVHVTYDELMDVMVSKKYQRVMDSINHRGELYTIGLLNFSAQGSLSLNKLYLENSLGDADSYYDTGIVNCLSLTFVCNENVFSTKKFDKLVLYCSGNQNTQKFTTFTFTDSDTNTTFTNMGTGYKMANGKHIVPITSTDGTSKAEGQYLIINGVVPITNYPVEVFGAIVHNRIVK